MDYIKKNTLMQGKVEGYESINKDKIKEGNIGLNILRLNLKQYRGVFEYEIFKNNEELEESYLQFKIKIPLDRRVVNENFVNRRS